MPGLLQQLAPLLIFGFLALFLNEAAKRGGFFTSPERQIRVRIRTVQLIVVFAIYLFLGICAIPLISKFLYLLNDGFQITILFAIKLQLLSLLLTLLLLSCYLYSQDKKMLRRLWKDKESVRSSYLTDIAFAFIAFLIAFPGVIFVGELCDLLLNTFFGVQHYEQDAVSFLKLALANSSVLSMALFTIILGAPCIEELLFRGFLQNFLKERIGIKGAILTTSIVFALFHMSPKQGLGNIALVSSLFIFSLYLGFLYERQRSLFASISLHALFNLFSALRIIFYMGGS